MRMLQLKMHLIPIINIQRVSREYEDDETDDTMMVENVFIHLRNGDVVTVEEETFEEVCALLNPIPQ